MRVLALAPLLLLGACVVEAEVPASVELVSVTAYFGECGGACLSAVHFDDAQVVYRSTGWDGTLYMERSSTLTVSGLADKTTLENDLAEVELLEVYGCPDCDDGGGVGVELLVDGVLMGVDYPAGQASTELGAVDAFFSQVLSALTDCEESEVVSLSEDCLLPD